MRSFPRPSTKLRHGFDYMTKRKLQWRTRNDVVKACVLCGALDGKCVPIPHDVGVVLMSRRQAAELASVLVRVDFKQRAAGDK
jgi:hypothetical protein